MHFSNAIRRPRAASLSLGWLLGLSGIAFSQVPVQGAFPDFPVPAGEVWVASGGLWTDPGAWTPPGAQTGVPGPGDSVYIPENIQIDIRSVVPAALATGPASGPGLGSLNYWPGVRYVRVEGTLRFGIHWETELVTDTLYIGSTGALIVGATNHPVRSDRTCKITILPQVTNQVQVGSTSPRALAINPVWDPDRASRGIVNDGTIRAFGEPREHVVVVDHDVVPDPASATSLVSVQSGWNWQDGDEMALAGTLFRRGKTVDDPLTDEAFDLSIVGANDGSAAPGDLVLEHVRALDPATQQPFDLHLVHLERNITFGSGWRDVFGSAPELRARGHFMSRHMTGTDVKEVTLNYVRFDQFGRTNKALPLGDVIFSTLDPTNAPGSTYSIATAPGFAGTAAGQVTNRRGRYAVHFHLNGHQSLPGPARKKLTGCVVTGTPGWGFVNHSSYVDFIDCVAYDFVGSGFVTESGDEVGSFQGCVAMHGTGPNHGTAAEHYFKSRQVFGDWSTGGVVRATSDPRFRPQPLSDFGFAGDGFWFQGPLVEAVDNIANSCSGAGMFWFTTGAVNDWAPLGFATPEKERYAGFPLDDLGKVYPAAVLNEILQMSYNGLTGPRTWSWSDDLVVLADLPILRAEGLQAYACLKGMHLRFSNHQAASYYNEVPFRYDIALPMLGFDPDARPEQRMEELELWNNEQVFRARYCNKTVWDNVVGVNQNPHFSSRVAFIGAELNHQVHKHTLNNVSVDGYGMALLVQDSAASNDEDNLGELSFSPGSFIATSTYAVLNRMDGDTEFGSLDGLWPRLIHDPVCNRIHQTTIDRNSFSVTPGQPGNFALNWAARPIPRTGSGCLPVSPSVYPQRFLIRYREPVSVTGSEAYSYYVHTTTSGTLMNTVDIPGFESGKAYNVQILADYEGTVHPVGNSPQHGPLAKWSFPTTVSVP